MPQSKRYRTLLSQLQWLSGRYLDFARRPGGDYSKRQLSGGAAYTIFAHAEVESFVEDWATRLTDRGETRWRAGHSSRLITTLVTFRDSPVLPSTIPARDVWAEPVFAALRWHRATIAGNHGIKEANLCKMLVPIGFDVRNIDPILIGDLSALATIRGDHAHQSAKVHLGQTFDPFDRESKVANITTLLADLDQQLAAYLVTC